MWTSLTRPDGTRRATGLRSRPFGRIAEAQQSDLPPGVRLLGTIPIAGGPLALIAQDAEGGVWAYPRGLAAVAAGDLKAKPLNLPRVLTGTQLQHAEPALALLVQEAHGLSIRVLREADGPEIARFEFPDVAGPLDAGRIWLGTAPDLGWAAIAYTTQEAGVDSTQIAVNNGQDRIETFQLQGALPVSTERAGAAAASGVHVVTRTPGTPFGYLTTLGPGEDGGWQKTGETVLTKLEADPALWASPDGAYAIFRDGEALARLSARGEFVWVADFDSLPGVCVWSGGGLFAAAGNVIFALAAENGEATPVAQLQSGWVAAAAALPATAYRDDDADFDGLNATQEAELGLDPNNPDTDGDGILDGRDPLPNQASATFEPPDELVLRARGAGRELRAWWMRASNDLPVRWQVAYDAATLPWLRLYPSEGVQSSPFYFGVDPIVARNASNASGVLELSLFDVATDTPAEGSPAHVAVRIDGPTDAARRILWLVSDEQPVDLRSVKDPHRWYRAMDVLGGPPQYFSHQWQHAAYAGSLDHVDMVVIEAAAAARGVLSQKAALDFVAGGGALLFLGGEEDVALMPYLQIWAGALGFELVSTPTARGPFAVDAESPISTSLQALALQSRHAFRSPRFTPVLTPDDDGYRFAAGTLGLGRIVLAADDSWLHADALATEDERGFVQDVFHWLAEAGRDVPDLDGDGLMDAVEDANRNGAFDPGETHFLLADTDGDGLPDGMEDRDRNGRQDPGETDARNPDSDGDSVWDGADAFAAPVFGAPVIQRLDPPQAPAEGMIEAALTGERLPQDARYLLGGHAARILEWSSPSLVRLQVPDAGNDAGGLVDLVIVPNDARPGAVLREGFRYSPRTRVKVELKPLAAADDQPFTLYAVEAFPPSAWRQVVAAVRPGPGDGPELTLHQVEPGYTAQTWSSPGQPYVWTFHNIEPIDEDKPARIAVLRVEAPAADAPEFAIQSTLVLGPGGGRLAAD
ncbi:MAG: hypothetical protein GC168_20350 [Candidatus Hydrogenedens sp.]|nr:hypothetical protein [Candidatus Hydrogenedens sp.]